MEIANKKREGFSTGLTTFLATLGSAVGIGNIWRFPYLTGENGGGAFLLIYLICVLLVGIPAMVSEFFMGRSTQHNSVGAFEELKPKSGWRKVGILGVISTYIVMFFYSCVSGWVYCYLYKAIRGDFIGATPETVKTQFHAAVIGPISPIFWQFVVMLVVTIVLILGVKNGIEALTKVLMPVLFVLIIICDIRALLLPGVWDGFHFLFGINFSQVTSFTVLTALGLAFFKLSVGTGTMITYASYFTKKNNMLLTAVNVCLSDTVVSLLAGIAIFPAVFSFGFTPQEGPGLLFMTIPLVFEQMPFGNLLLIAFFLLTAIAATTATLSQVEVPVAYFSEERKLPRYKAVILSTSIIFVFGILATLSAEKQSILGSVTIMGRTFFALFDDVHSKILLPLVGILIAILVGWGIDNKLVIKELTNDYTLKTERIAKFIHFLIKNVTPALLILIFLYTLWE